MWLFLLFALLTVAYPVVCLVEIFDRDWRYFDSLSLLTRSSLLGYRGQGGPFLPIHDPWCGGGLNVLANPQNRIFSPLLVLDLAFSPYWANLVGLVVYAFFGLWGMYRLVREFEIPRTAAALTAILFINGSWFGLHFAEGHIPYGSMQLLPWVLWAFLRIERKGAQLLLTSLLALFLVDGGMYTFIFSLLLLLSAWVAGLKRTRDVTRAFRQSPAFFAACILAMLLVASSKLLPVLAEIRGRAPQLGWVEMPYRMVLASLFWPAQKLILSVSGKPESFHEFGCYLGLVPCALLVIRWLRGPGLLKKDGRLIALCLFWFWIASGWFLKFNPWLLFQKIPVINNAHIQSRLFLLMFLFYLLLVARELARKDSAKKSVVFLFCFLATESVFVRNFPFVFYRDATRMKLGHFIQSDRLDQTRALIEKPGVYLTHNLASAQCYEPSAPFFTRVISNDKPDYRGEIYLERGAGHAEIKSYLPGRVEIGVSGAAAKTIVLNTNDLGHWRAESSDAQIVSKRGELLKLEVPAGDRTLRLRFMPWYWTYCVMGWGLGVALFIRLFHGYKIER